MNLSPRCYAVTGLGYSAPWCVNAGFIVGDIATLVVDTGANALAGQTVHGYASALRPGNQLWAIDTEKHFDHIGGNSYFRAQGVPIWGHAGIARTPGEFQTEIAEFNDTIPSAMRREHWEAHAFFHGTRLQNTPAAAFRGGNQVSVPHPTLHSGDTCPECLRGRVYRQKEPATLVRFVGHAPLEATVFEMERLRCLCRMKHRHRYAASGTMPHREFVSLD